MLAAIDCKNLSVAASKLGAERRPWGQVPCRGLSLKPVIVFNEDQEWRFLEACDDWQFPIFVTLMLTGLRPGELIHLLLPDDLDLENGCLRVRNNRNYSTVAEKSPNSGQL